MNYSFSEQTREELLHSIEYYESQQTGLGEIFFSEVFAAINRVIEFPESWTPLDKTFSRCLVNRFPYALIYTIEDGVVLITAVMNLHREPDYWRT